MKFPYLLHGESTQVGLNWIPRTAQYGAPISLDPVLARLRNDDLNVCDRLRDNLKLMGNGMAMEHFLATFAAMPQCFRGPENLLFSIPFVTVRVIVCC